MTAARSRKQPGYSGHPALPLRASLRLFKIAAGDFVSLHADVASEADKREKSERLVRHITRPAVSTERLSLTAQRNSRYRLKTPYRDGTTDMVFEPWDKIAPGDLVKIDTLTCEGCGGAVKVIASIEDPVVVKTIPIISRKPRPQRPCPDPSPARRRNKSCWA